MLLRLFFAAPLEIAQLRGHVEAFRREQQARLEHNEDTREWLDGYFAGASADIASLNLEMRGAPFELRVWEALRLIPPGTTTTYSAIAKQLEMALWQPESLRIILAVRRLREAGVPAFFSIDTGATVYVNTVPERADEVRKAIEELGIRTIPCEVGGPARITDDPLF